MRILHRWTAVALGLLASLAPGAAVAQMPGLPESIRAGRHDVFLLSAAMARGLDDDARIGLLLSGCRRRLRLTEVDSTATVRARPWPLMGPRVQDPSILTILILPTEPVFVDCGDATGQQVIAAARGIRITNDTLYDGERDVLRVALRRGDRELAPLESERTPIVRFGAYGVVVNGAGLIRLAIPIDSLAPDASGAIPDLRLLVWNDQDSVPSEVAIPWQSVAAIWKEFLPARSARAAATAGRPEAPLFLADEPRDSVLRRARSRYLAADIGGGNAIVAERLRTSRLTAADLLHARTQLGVSLAQLGDSSAARVLLGLAMSTAPCLTLAPAAPSEAERMLGSIRRGDQDCAAPVLWKTALRGALIPGFGSTPTTARRRSAIVGLLGVAGAFALASSNRSASRATYDDYLAIDLPSALPPELEAQRLYSVAEQQRRTSITYLRIGGAIWVATWAEALLSEYRVKLHLASATGYGSVRSGPSFTPRGGAQGLGLSINFF